MTAGSFCGMSLHACVHIGSCYNWVRPNWFSMYPLTTGLRSASQLENNQLGLSYYCNRMTCKLMKEWQQRRPSDWLLPQQKQTHLHGCTCGYLIKLHALSPVKGAAKPCVRSFHLPSLCMCARVYQCTDERSKPIRERHGTVKHSVCVYMWVCVWVCVCVCVFVWKADAVSHCQTSS